MNNGLLAQIYSFGNTTRNKLRGLLDDPVGTLQQIADATAAGLNERTGKEEAEQRFALRDRIKAGDKNALAEYKQLGDKFNQKMLNLALDSNPAAVGMTAWHGSPHKFDKFDLAKIGTGEGAQAYGHGLYLAEAPSVAKEYAEKLSSAGLAKNTLSRNAGDFNKAISDAESSISGYRELIANGGGGDMRRAQSMLSIAEKKLADLKSMQQGTLDEAGNLYKTDIPDEAVARFLDWDKPLSQQAPEVQKILGFSTRTEDAIHAEASKIFEEGNKRAGKAGGWSNYPDLVERYNALNKELDSIAPNISGADYYRGTSPDNFLHSVLNNASTYPAASSELLSKGIPGIRYLDGGSRSAGQGSSNFVIFDPEMIRILERNGEATGAQPWKPGEWGGLLK